MYPPIQIIHQKDKHQDKIVGEFYHLDGVPKYQGKRLDYPSRGFEWVPGCQCRGSWSTKKLAVIQPFIDSGVPVFRVGNGHEKPPAEYRANN